MTLEPLIQATPAIQLHAGAAVAALFLGGAQLYLLKGGFRHKVMGWIWVSLMMVIAVTSFWIHEINQYRGYSLIHLLSVWTLIAVPLAIVAVRHGNVKRHQYFMKSLYFFALIVAGLFTLLPGRVMFEVLFGS